MVIILAPYHQDTEKIARIKLPQVPQVTPNYGIFYLRSMIEGGERGSILPTWTFRILLPELENDIMIKSKKGCSISFIKFLLLRKPLHKCQCDL